MIAHRDCNHQPALPQPGPHSLTIPLDDRRSCHMTTPTTAHSISIEAENAEHCTNTFIDDDLINNTYLQRTYNRPKPYGTLSTMDQFDRSFLSSPGSEDNVRPDNEAENLQDKVDSSMDFHNQIHYCQMCQRLIAFLKERFSNWDVRHEFELDVGTILSSTGCCLCTLLLRGCGHFLSDQRYLPTRLTAFPRANMLLVSCGNSDAWFNCHELGNSFDYNHRVTESTDSDPRWKLANEWLKNCKSRHDCSAAAPDAPLPTRLVKVNAVSGIPSPCLIESSTLSIWVDYCTLSHCWGDGIFLKLTRQNYDSFIKSIPYNDLSPTFRDAIYAAHRMEFEYIWIDSLCIIQYDDHDWSKEAGTMGRVYAGSGLNLAATSAKDSRYGLFRSRNPAAVLPCIIRSFTSATKQIMIYIQYLWETQIEHSILSSRAWVLQERVLAPRTLHFGSNQLFWECTAGVACESCPWDPASAQNYLKGGLHEVRNPKLFDAWNLAVKHYSTAKLSFESDKYVAFAGIAKYLSEKGRGPYIAGLWRDNLEFQLLWKPQHLNGTRPRAYRAPSWSWMALDGVEISPRSEPPTDSDMKNEFTGLLVRIQDIFIEPKIPGDHYGEIISASLSIRCSALKKFTAIENIESGKYEVILPRRDHHEVSMYLDVIEKTEQMPPEIFLLRVSARNDALGWHKVKGLLLQRSRHRKNCYERIGRFRSSFYYSDWGHHTGQYKESRSRYDTWWGRLENAEMDVRAGPNYSCLDRYSHFDPEDLEQFIITLV